MNSGDSAPLHEMEQQVRMAFGAAADTISAGDLPGRPFPLKAPGTVRRLRSLAPRLRLRAVMAPVAAASGVTAIAVTAAVLVPALTGSSPAPSAGAGRGLAGTPAFFAGVEDNGPVQAGRPPDTVLGIFRTATGRAVATVRPPRAGWINSVATLGGDRTFVIAVVGLGSCISRFYQFRISTTGQPGALVPLSVPKVMGRVNELTGSAGGNELAYTASGPCVPPGQHQIGAINLAARKVTTWTFPVRTSGRHPVNTFADSLSLTADGKQLGVLAGAYNPPEAAPVWVLATSEPGGPLTRHARKAVTSNTEPYREILSPSGARVSLEVDAVLRPSGGGKAYSRRWTAVATYRVSTGTIIGAVGEWLVPSTEGPALWMTGDASGQHVLAHGFASSAVTLLNLQSGRETTVRSKDLAQLTIRGAAISMAW